MSYCSKHKVEAVECVQCEVDELKEEVARLKDAIAKESFDIEQTLGQALGSYPWYKDDPKNFPNSTEADGVCVGDHVPGSLAAEAADLIRKQRVLVDAYAAALEEIREADPKVCPFEIFQIADTAILHQLYKDWAPWDGQYRKTWYLARTKDGRVYGCWPNAGKMVCCHKHEGVKFTDEDDIEVREATLDEIQELT